MLALCVTMLTNMEDSEWGYVMSFLEALVKSAIIVAMVVGVIAMFVGWLRIAFCIGKLEDLIAHDDKIHTSYLLHIARFGDRIVEWY